MLVPSKLVLGLVVAVGFGAAADAQVKVTNPGFAAKEVFTYEETVGSSVRSFDASLTLVGEGASARYEYKTADADLESSYRLDPVTLLSLSSETLTHAPDADVRRTADYRNIRPKAGPDDLVVTDLGSLPAGLRGFPWGAVASAKLVYLGNPGVGNEVSFVFTVVGKEKVTAAGKSWDCWHATLGLDGALSLLLAKTDYWFAADGSHPLVKVTGPSAGPGSPTRTLLLKSWVSTGSP